MQHEPRNVLAITHTQKHTKRGLSNYANLKWPDQPVHLQPLIQTADATMAGSSKCEQEKELVRLHSDAVDLGIRCSYFGSSCMSKTAQLLPGGTVTIYSGSVTITSEKRSSCQNVLYAVCDMFMYIGQCKRLFAVAFFIWNQTTIDVALSWYPEKIVLSKNRVYRVDVYSAG